MGRWRADDPRGGLRGLTLQGFVKFRMMGDGTSNPGETRSDASEHWMEQGFNGRAGQPTGVREQHSMHHVTRGVNYGQGIAFNFTNRN